MVVAFFSKYRDITVLLFIQGMHVLKVWKMQINIDTLKKVKKEETSPTMPGPAGALSAFQGVCPLCRSGPATSHAISRTEEQRVLALAGSGLLLADLLWLWAPDWASRTLHFACKIGTVFART